MDFLFASVSIENEAARDPTNNEKDLSIPDFKHNAKNASIVSPAPILSIILMAKPSAEKKLFFFKS